MRDTLYIHLGTSLPDGTVEWSRVPEGATEAAVERSALDEAGRQAAGCRVVALVPGEDVTLARAVIPARNRQRVMAALPYVLEDRLIPDVETLHFAPGMRESGGALCTAVVERARMDQWIERLRAAGIVPDMLVPDTLSLPFEAGAWTVLDKGEISLVRTAAQGGFALDSANFALLLPLSVEEAGDQRPERIVLYDDAHKLDIEFPRDSGVHVEWRAASGSRLALMVRHFSEQAAINLLQGDYSRREQLGRVWRPWIPAALLLAILLLVNAGMTLADYITLSRENTALEQEIQAIYLDAFPDARRVVNPRAQMEQGLAALRGGGAGCGGFLALMNDAAAPLKQVENLILQRVSYHDGKLDLALVIGDLQALDQLKQQLIEQAGMTVDIQSASALNDRVEARLQLAKRGP
ncbi:MAG: type II secretion system protein GspL [Gammaproteobacteria bacterium]|nr:type II secretion system protein GspL [Gammaproteobacteria bacterium]